MRTTRVVTRSATYRLRSRWLVPAPVEVVYEILSRPTEYPDWWGDVFLEATGDAAPAAPGKHARVVTRGFLPYRLRWGLTCVEATRPARIVSELNGDFEGTGSWSLTQVPGETEAVLDWHPRVEKALVRRLSPLLRPLFVANHRWAMRRGERAIERLVAPDHEAGSQTLQART